MSIETPLRNRVNSKVLPDPDDPNFYCESCDAKYPTRTRYHYHIKYIHKIQLAPLKVSPIYDPNMKKIDENDVKSTSCFLCKLTFGTRNLYRRHRRRHLRNGRMNSELNYSRRKVPIDTNILPDIDDPNGYCKVCDRKSTSLKVYINHIRFFHGAAKYRQPKPNMDIIPDTKDPKDK